MGAKMVSLRLDEELLAWATEYAEAHGVSRTDLLASALDSFRDDCERGVPEMRRAAREQSSVLKYSPERGVGRCPEREEGMGHVWESHKVHPQRPCKFCGYEGRKYFDMATRARAELFQHLRQPQSVRGTTVAEKTENSR